MARAYIALGANLGDRRRNIESAIQLLRQTAGLRVVQVAPLLETDPVGGPDDSPRFFNSAAEVETDLSPEQLLDHLLAIERQLGRQRREKWGPRLIDLDLLLYDQLILQTPGLTIPHPLMHQRRFVLEPLARIAPQVRHPALKKTISELLDEILTQESGNS